MAEPKTRTRKPVAPHLQEAKAMGSIAKTLDALDAQCNPKCPRCGGVRGFGPCDYYVMVDASHCCKTCWTLEVARLRAESDLRAEASS